MFSFKKKGFSLLFKNEVWGRFVKRGIKIKRNLFTLGVSLYCAIEPIWGNKTGFEFRR